MGAELPNEMKRWKGWLCFNFKRSFLLPAQGVLFKVTSCLNHKNKGNRQGLVRLYKDMEGCAGYEDIQVMWEKIHSSCPPSSPSTPEAGRGLLIGDAVLERELNFVFPNSRNLVLDGYNNV